MLNIVDGGSVNTCPELEFGLDFGRPLSPVEILQNFCSWLDSAIATEPFDVSQTATALELNMVYRDALLDAKRWLHRLEAWEWV